MIEEENAAELTFGDEFDFDKTDQSNLKCLTNDQVYYLLSSTRNSGNPATTETFDQTISFIEKVATTRIHEDIGNLIGELGIQLKDIELERKEDHKIVRLHPFEVASLANLIKAEETSVEEALGWIPSLSRFDDEEILKAVNLVVEAKGKVCENM